VSGGHYLGAPTVAEILHRHGLRSVIAGSKQVALLHDRAPRPDESGSSPVLYEGATLPVAAEAPVVRMLGAFPPIPEDQDKVARDAWTTGALLGSLWREPLPPYTLLWLAEPDFSQHATGPGSAQSLRAVRSSDDNLGRVLADLDRRGLRPTTDVLVVSDHGFSTVARKVDVAAELSGAGFRAERAALGGLKPADVLVVSDTGSSLIYVGGHDPEVCRRVAYTLQQQDWAGVVFSREPIEGTFPLREARIDSPGGPGPGPFPPLEPRGVGSDGRAGPSDLGHVAFAARKAGNHTSLSPYDMHNTLVAAGPDLKRRGVVDTLPTGNTDIAPTILWILGLRERGRPDGRPRPWGGVKFGGAPAAGLPGPKA
jgi:hypothetical protein